MRWIQIENVKNSIFQINIDTISTDEEDIGPFINKRNSSCDFDIKSTCDFDVKSIYSEVIENGPKR